MDTVVSLTTYGRRLQNGDFMEAIKSILEHNPKTNIHTALTLFEDDIVLLSEKTKRFIEYFGIELLISKINLRPHLKYFHAMQKYKDVPIITIDDDCIYENGLIDDLMLEYKNGAGDLVLAKRVHEITYNDDLTVKPYNEWNFQCTWITEPSYELLATGVGGVLYPPGILKITDRNIPEILNTSLTNDDLYLRKKETLAGIKVKYIPPTSGKLPYTLLPTARDNKALCMSDNKAKNNELIRNLNFDKCDRDEITASVKDPLKKPAVNIVYVTDENYAIPTLASIRSIKAHTSERQYNIFVLCDEVSPETIARFQNTTSRNFKTSAIDISGKYINKNSIADTNNISKTAINKFFIPYELQNLTKVLYLDGDTIATDCIDELYDKDISNKFAGVVRDFKVHNKYVNPFFKNIILKNGGYFNSGVMLLNLLKMRKTKMPDKLLQYRTNGKNIFQDQDALNVKFSGNVRWLEVKYNFIASNLLFDQTKISEFYQCQTPNGYYEIENGEHKPVIFHITGIEKPWNTPNSPADKIYRKYAIDAIYDKHEMKATTVVQQEQKQGQDQEQKQEQEEKETKTYNQTIDFQLNDQNLKHDVVFILGDGSKHEDDEIAIAMASLVKFCKDWIGNIYIVGSKPRTDLSRYNYTFVPCEDPYDTKDKNIIYKINYAIKNIPDLTENFLKCSDDQIVSRKTSWSDFNPMYIKEFSKSDEKFYDYCHPRKTGNNWLKYLYDTLRRFDNSKIPVYFYEPHVWSPINKTSFSKMCEEIDYANQTNIVLFSLYYNYIKYRFPVKKSSHVFFSKPMIDWAGVFRRTNARFISYNEDAFSEKFELELIKIVRNTKNTKQI